MTTLKAQFQATAVEKSNQKIIFQGKMYYVHTVKQGQTLFSICKTYEVTEGEIQKANPNTVLKPLSVGTVLRIPFGEESESITERQIDETSGSDDFIYHTVLPKQTPYFLHSKYNVPLEIIYYYNPGTENGLQIGQVVRIPKQKLLEKEEKKNLSLQEDLIRYEVKPGDTLYRIALDNGVTVSAIVNANKSLRWGLKAGQIIIIPTENSAALMATMGKQDSILLVTALTGFTSWQCDSIRMQKRMRPPTKVALLLPFFAQDELQPDTTQIQIDSISGEIIKAKPKPFKGRGAAEFYEGFLLAVDSLRRTGLNISLFVYDTEGDTNRMEEILNELDIVEPDLILGPFYADNVRRTSKYAFEHKIPFIPPLMKGDTTILNNPYLFQVYPSTESEYIWQAKYLSQKQSENLLYLYKPSIRNEEEIAHFKQLLTNHLASQPSTDSLLITDIVINDSLNYILGKVLRKDTMNYAIVFSSYEPEVINSLSQLHFHLREFPIKVFGQPSWQVFPNIRIDHFHDLEATIYSPFFIDYTSPHVKRFVEICRNKLKYEPYKTTTKGTGLNYTFLGYDLSMYFLKSSYFYGEELCNCVSNYKPALLMTTYHFVRNSSAGCFENDHINFIRYTKEYDVVEEYLERIP
jgi:LysM repeat protein